MQQTTIEDETMDLTAIQSALRDSNLDGWLFYDHHNRDPIAYRILGMTPARTSLAAGTTSSPRRASQRSSSTASSPTSSTPSPARKNSTPPGRSSSRNSKRCSTGATKIAMQYSPRNAIMYVSMVDAGTIELLRELRQRDRHLRRPRQPLRGRPHRRSRSPPTTSPNENSTPSSTQAGTRSANESVRTRAALTSTPWSSSSSERHRARRHGQGIRPQRLRRPQLRRLPLRAHRRHPPGPSAVATSSSSTSGRKLANDPSAVWYDITWTAVVGRAPTDREQHIFTTVRDARDAAIARVQDKPSHPTSPSQATRPTTPPARSSATQASPTGSPTVPATTSATELHGNGAHLDNLETHDYPPHPPQHLLLRRTRPLLPRRIRRPQRGQHDHPPRQRRGHRPHPD